MEIPLPAINEYAPSLHLHLSREQHLSLNAFIIAQPLQNMGLLPIWLSRMAFQVPASSPQITFSGAHLASGTADDKLFLNSKAVFKARLREEGISVAPGEVFREDQYADALAFASAMQAPVVLKPSRGNKGQGATIGLTDLSLFQEAFTLACAHGREKGVVILEEQFTNAQEVRFLTVGGQCVGAFVRVPPRVLGDGESSILALIEQTNQRKGLNPNECRLPLKLNNHRCRLLAKQGYTEDSVPPRGTWVKIDEKGNISDGADSFECKDLIHPGYIEIAERVSALARTVVVVGIDMLIRDLTKAPSPENYIVIEGNTGPASTGHVYPTYGAPADVAGATLDYCFEHASFDYGFDQPLKVEARIFSTQPATQAKAHQYLRSLCIQFESFGMRWSERRNTLTIEAGHRRLASIARLFEQEFDPTHTALCFFNLGSS